MIIFEKKVHTCVSASWYTYPRGCRGRVCVSAVSSTWKSIMEIRVNVCSRERNAEITSVKAEHEQKFGSKRICSSG